MGTVFWVPLLPWGKIASCKSVREECLSGSITQDTAQQVSLLLFNCAQERWWPLTHLRAKEG